MRILTWLSLIVFLISCAQAQPTPGQPKLPPGFKLSVYANVPSARSMALAPDGTLYVGTRNDKVFRVAPGGGKVEVLAEGLNGPNGVAFHQGKLYVGEVHRVLRFDQPASSGNFQVLGELPKETHHGYRFLRVGPDGKLYVGIGAPCNVCEVKDPYGSICRFENGRLEVIARGVRNTVGFDWHPRTGELWFTDNGRDWLGDNRPPCELNRLSKEGLHFGFPYRWGKNEIDPDLGPKTPKGLEFEPPALGFAAHVAPLGMRFYRGTMFPARYRGQIFVAQHGSWNRSSPIGYRVMVVRLEGNKVIESKPFLDGFLSGGSVSGRPVDVQELKDGSLLVSDDSAGKVYRIVYGQ